jgi:hypothetical protein
MFISNIFLHSVLTYSYYRPRLSFLLTLFFLLLFDATLRALLSPSLLHLLFISARMMKIGAHKTPGIERNSSPIPRLSNVLFNIVGHRGGDGEFATAIAITIPQIAV